MRLTHLKLAGFKSFVDSTTLKIHGDRAGIVGPNGCGKSNVMESVRWVLGESSAKELRGDSMDAVIFNGSENRKPISRASVELFFDNTAGTAAGEWAKYAEISVKRVIEREKGSTYYINNSVVRKKDVADLFLGTGLGSRAYAIIGQNTINRIVEAKPEELRVFLEEAAGISKYKERRRETELRLRDTRENLIRVEDILQELEKQIERLEGQAEVAAKYTNLHNELATTKGQILLLKKQQGFERWQSAQHQTQKLVNELESQVANLRHHESALETARQSHIEHTDNMNQAQATFYEVNAEVSSLENQINTIQDNNARMKTQLEQFTDQAEKHATQRRDVEMQLDDALEAHESLETAFSEAGSKITTAKQQLTEKTQQFHTVMQEFQQSQKSLSDVEQSLRIEQNSLQHQHQSYQDAQNQVERLGSQLSEMVLPDDSGIETLKDSIATKQESLHALEDQLHDAQAEEQALADAMSQQRTALTAEQKTLHTIEAEISSLEKLQQSINAANNKGDLSDWLKHAQLDTNPRLWQKIKVEHGWETAVEAALTGRLNALMDADLQTKNPPNALTLVLGNAESLKSQTIHESSLLNRIELLDDTAKSVLTDWLSQVVAVEDDAAAIQQYKQLPAGQVLVTKSGNIYTQYSVSYFGPQTQLHGVLERQAELDKLQLQRPEVLLLVENAQSVMQTQEADLKTTRQQTQSNANNIKQLNHQIHQDTLQLQKAQQQIDSAAAKQARLKKDAEVAQAKLTSINQNLTQQKTLIDEASINLNALRQQKQSHESTKNKAESERNEARSVLHRLEKSYQEQDFNIKLNNKSVQELENKLSFLEDEQHHAKSRQAELTEALNKAEVGSFIAKLETLLNNKQDHEKLLAEARNKQSESEMQLQTLEKERMQTEQLLHPLRDKVESSRLAEQEKRLNFEQFKKELSASTASEDELSQSLAYLNADRQEKPLTIKELELKESKFDRQIESLGAVNLAAIQELEAETTRRDLLAQQTDDLIEASETLENAIKKIDRETRGRLQSTYDKANENFAELFSTLFNGGKARLELLGDEILDTGIQVFAQPPGKKNSTIHLLSGGEKALTAIALVFALFRLNPAPFCLMDEVDAPLDDSNTERFCAMVKKMSEKTQFLYVSHNKITMEMAQQLIGVTMQESGVSRIVDVDMEEAVKMAEA